VRGVCGLWVRVCSWGYVDGLGGCRIGLISYLPLDPLCIGYIDYIYL